jgi:hypothetical protein
MDNITKLAASGGGGPAIVNPALGTTLTNMLRTNGGVYFIQQLVTSAITLLIIVGGVLFVFMFLLGAIGFIAAGGDKIKMDNARGRMSTAFIGIILLFSSWAIIELIEVIFGVKILLIDLAPLIITN